MAKDRREYQHKYYLAHRDEVIAASKQRYKDNTDLRREQMKAWYQKKKFKEALGNEL